MIIIMQTSATGFIFSVIIVLLSTDRNDFILCINKSLILICA